MEALDLVNANLKTDKVPEFIKDLPEVADNLSLARLTCYCMNCYHKGTTVWITPNFGPLCVDCLKELENGINDIIKRSNSSA